MQEIANRFKEEYTELLSRYKEHLSNAQIMSILQSVTKKQIGFKDNPERFKGLGYAKGFPIVDELNHCSAQEIAEASCDGDIRRCNDACHKRVSQLKDHIWGKNNES